MTTRTAQRYAAETIDELRKIAQQYQDAGDKLGVRMIEQTIQRINETW